jgi:RNA polymerase sigma-70 factor (ECF subfamily)
MNAGTDVWSQCGSEGEEALQRERTEDTENAFAALVERHSRLMFRIAYSLLRNPHDAEDAVQESFLKLYRGDAWRQMKDEKAFLARTVWRVALDRLPARASQRDDVAGTELASVGASPEESAVAGDAHALLRRLIDSLPEELRQALLLSAIEEMTSREVATAMGIPEGTVRTRLMRAKTELKKRFEAMKGVRR